MGISITTSYTISTTFSTGTGTSFITSIIFSLTTSVTLVYSFYVILLFLVTVLVPSNSLSPTITSLPSV